MSGPRTCDGFSRCGSTSPQAPLSPCPYEAVETRGQFMFCTFHTKVYDGLIVDRAEGQRLIPLSWLPNLATPRSEPDMLEQLLREWA